MTASTPALLQVRPDSGRVELALLEASRREGFVDAGGQLTFSQLVEACGGPAFAALAPADPLLVRALLAVEAPTRARAVFGEVAMTADFARSAELLRGELVAQDVSPSALGDVALPGRTGEKARALATLFTTVDERLEALGFVDRRAVVHLATRRLKARGLPESLQRFEAIEVRDLHDLPPSRLAFLDALARACVAAGRRFRLVLPWTGSAHTDAFVGGVARFFEKRWESLEGVELAPEVPPGERSLHLRQLFAAQLTAAPVPGLELASCATPRDEARTIAVGVKHALEQGTPIERIAVAFRDLADDTELLVEQFDALGIPVRARLGVPLSASPVGRLALSLLTLADDDFPVAAVAALLESRYAPALSKGMPPCRGLFAEAGVRNDAIGAKDGRGAWMVRLGALLDRRTREAAERRSLTADVHALEALVGGVKRVLFLGRSIPPRAPALALLEAWWKGVASLGVEVALAAPEPPLPGRLLEAQIDRAVARDQASFEALTSTVRGLRRALEVSQLGAVVMERRTFARWLALATADVNLQARGPRAGAVRLLDVRELPGAGFDRLFLGGLLDGRFPGRPSPGALLSDDERAELNQAAGVTLFRLAVMDDGVALPLRLAEDRLLLHHALVAAPRVTITFCRSDGRGREALRSPFLDALERTCAGLPSTVLPHRPVPSLDEVECDAELAARAALELFSPVETRLSARDLRVGVLGAVVARASWLPTAQVMSAIELERLRFFSRPDAKPGRFSGALGGAVLERLQPSLEWGVTRPISASQLESWANCHFLGLGRRVLRLEEDERAGEEMDHRALGDLLHAALKRLLPALQARGQWPPSKQQLELVTRELDAALAEAAQEVGRTMPVGHHLLFEVSVDRARRELLRLVFEPAITPIVGAAPRAFETPFGRKDAPPAVQQVSIPPALPHERPVFLTGAIDRLDVAPALVAVIDYKLSRPGTPKGRLDGLLLKDFQLPLYLYVARALYPERAVDAAWVGLRKSESLVLSRVLKNAPYGLDDVLSIDLERRRDLATRELPNLANAVHALHGSLRRGDFGARPLDCEYCHLRSVCRISARRLSETEGD
ncbi:MAG: PD-(D/E)XK nuclease family protein [Myxococcaceae bacterium]|nr:PD-(D/E)XK nuclease family protein [Myxococcaceae bacterium]